MYNILLISDQRCIRNNIKEILEYEGHDVAAAASALAGIEAAKLNRYNIILFSLSNQEMDIYEFTSRCQLKETPPIVVITESGGAQNYPQQKPEYIASILERPLTAAKIISTIKRLAAKNTKQVKENLKERAITKKAKRGSYTCQESIIIGVSEGIQRLKSQIDKVAKCDARVLIIGANGTGKELVAKRLHLMSPRCNNPFIELNCAAIPNELIESEMFGHEKGSFTSAYTQRKGKFELATGGTLFMDEIGDMTLSAQAKVLRALQERRITRVGGDSDIPVDTRVIAATNKYLPQEIANGRFREDLYHRLGVVILYVPTLKERREDIPLLITHFLSTLCSENGIAQKSISKDAIELLTNHPWSGNVRELRNVIERLIIFSEGTIDTNDVDQYVLTDYYHM